jgi:hypothetical protein
MILLKLDQKEHLEMLRKPVVGPIFPKSSEWPGDHFVLFTNTQEFFNKVVFAAKDQGLRVEGRRSNTTTKQNTQGRPGDSASGPCTPTNASIESWKSRALMGRFALK